MKIYQVMLLAGAAATMLSACSSQDTPEVDNNGKKEITLLCQYPGETRATDTNFENSDQIGVFITEADAALQIGGNVLNNEQFTYNGSTWAAARKAYWDAGTFNVYAYYPYAKSVNDTEDYSFEVQTDQSTHEGVTASDFLWASKEGVTASASPVTLKFSHSLSKVIVKIEKSEDYEGDIPNDCKVSIIGTVTKACVDLSTGGVAKDNYAGTGAIVAQKIDNTTYQAIVVPQNIETRRPLIEIESEGVSYLMEGKLSFKQGCAHTLVVTLSKNPTQTKIEIGGSIGGWN